MKRIFITLSLFACILVANGQKVSEEVKVTIFTHEEKDNLQNWFQEELKRMDLSQEQESQYNSIVTYYTYKMSRLDDLDQDWTRKEFKEKLEEYQAKQDAELKQILTEGQFAIHQELYGEFLRSAYRRWGLE